MIPNSYTYSSIIPYNPFKMRRARVFQCQKSERQPTEDSYDKCILIVQYKFWVSWKPANCVKIYYTSHVSMNIDKTMAGSNAKLCLQLALKYNKNFAKFWTSLVISTNHYPYDNKTPELYHHMNSLSLLLTAHFSAARKSPWSTHRIASSLVANRRSEFYYMYLQAFHVHFNKEQRQHVHRKTRWFMHAHTHA
jgi:hypothetical protein